MGRRYHSALTFIPDEIIQGFRFFQAPLSFFIIGPDFIVRGGIVKPPADIVVLVVDRFLQYIQQGGKKRRSALKYEMSVSHQGECLTELFVSILLRLDLSQGFAEGFPG